MCDAHENSLSTLKYTHLFTLKMYLIYVNTMYLLQSHSMDAAIENKYIEHVPLRGPLHSGIATSIVVWHPMSRLSWLLWCNLFDLKYTGVTIPSYVIIKHNKHVDCLLMLGWCVWLVIGDGLVCMKFMGVVGGAWPTPQVSFTIPIIY